MEFLQFCRDLNYAALLEQGCIPEVDSALLTAKLPRFPTFVYKLDCKSSFSSFVRLLLLAFIDETLGEVDTLLSDPGEGAVSRALAEYQKEVPISTEDYQTLLREQQTLLKFYGNCLDGVDAEHVYTDRLQDLFFVGSSEKITAVYTGAQLRKNCREIWTACCAFVARNPCQALCLISTLHKNSSFEVEVSLVDSSTLLANKRDRSTEQEIETLLDDYGIGTSINVLLLLGLPPETLQIVVARPFQTMLRDSVTGESGVDRERLLSLQDSLEGKWRPYIHSVLAVNTAAPYWSHKHETIIDDLLTGALMGARGVIIHVGACGKLEESAAIETMRKNVKRLLLHATEDCRLCVETGCGEGKEIVWRPQELQEFVMSFSSEERKRLAVCFDTCHLFVAGFDPLLELQKWNDALEEGECDVPVRLVHFNDSQDVRCSHRDRHAAAGRGFLGLEGMTLIAQFCKEREIDCVTEW